MPAFSTVKRCPLCVNTVVPPLVCGDDKIICRPVDDCKMCATCGDDDVAVINRASVRLRKFIIGCEDDDNVAVNGGTDNAFKAVNLFADVVIVIPPPPPLIPVDDVASPPDNDNNVDDGDWGISGGGTEISFDLLLPTNKLEFFETNDVPSVFIAGLVPTLTPLLNDIAFCIRLSRIRKCIANRLGKHFGIDSICVVSVSISSINFFGV